MIGIEALSFHSLRQGQHGAVFVIINFSDAAQTIPLPGPMKRCPGRGGENFPASARVRRCGSIACPIGPWFRDRSLVIEPQATECDDEQI